MHHIVSGVEVKVALGGVWKQSLSELSGGQRSLLSLSLILSLLLFKPAPFYILDEVRLHRKEREECDEWRLGGFSIGFESYSEYRPDDPTPFPAVAVHHRLTQGRNVQQCQCLVQDKAHGERLSSHTNRPRTRKLTKT